MRILMFIPEPCALSRCSPAPSTASGPLASHPQPTQDHSGEQFVLFFMSFLWQGQKTWRANRPCFMLNKRKSLFAIVPPPHPSLVPALLIPLQLLLLNNLELHLQTRCWVSVTLKQEGAGEGRTMTSKWRHHLAIHEPDQEDMCLKSTCYS